MSVFYKEKKKIGYDVPPVTRKYDNRTNENMVIADGWWNHDGCFIFKFGISSK